MAPIAITVVIVVSLLASAAVHGQQTDEVTCDHQQEVCRCESTANECHFKLEIEELQTFTSYGLNVDGTVLTRRIPGDTYYLDRDGFKPSLSNCTARRQRLPECGGPCWSEEFRTLSDFSGAYCSMPMTVDGNTYRLFIAVNGRIPGPTLVVTEGQIIAVTVTNKLTSEGVTIHWHGMHQRWSPWMDGVAFISQGPIAPGAQFDYIFRARPAGTHWYHSHAGAQRTDGLFGALIVKEKDPATIQRLSRQLGDNIVEDDQHTLTLLDWQREASLNLFVQLHSTLGFYPQKDIGVVPDESQSDKIYRRTRSLDGVEVGPQPYWSGLINGRGRHDSSTPSKLSVFNVSNGITYRFRLIGAQSLFAYRFSIDGHMLKVIASDGHFIQPRDVHYVIIHTGERYDVLVTANQTTNNYWIRAETLETGVLVNPPHSAEAVLHYNSAQDVQNDTTYSSVSSPPWTCTSNAPCDVLNCPFRSYQNQNISCIHLTELIALNPSNIPNSVDLTDSTTEVRMFNFGFEGSSSTSAINGHNFRLPVTPYQTYSDAYQQDQASSSRRSCSQCGTTTTDNEQCECSYTAEIGSSTFNRENPPTIVFILSVVGLHELRNNDFSHPVHLHGHSFNVLHIEHGVYDNAGRLINNTDHIICDNRMCREPKWNTNYPYPSYLNATSGILKDTVIVPAGGYVVIAFQADNPGYWFMHCHIESHQLEGMGVIIREYDESQHNPPPAGINKIGDFSWTAENFRQLVGRASQSANIRVFAIIITTILGLVMN